MWILLVWILIQREGAPDWKQVLYRSDLPTRDACTTIGAAVLKVAGGGEKSAGFFCVTEADGKLLPLPDADSKAP